MNKRLQIGLILAITLVLLLGLTIHTLAKRAPDLVVEYVFNDVDWDTYHAIGTYEVYWTATPEPFWSGTVDMDWSPNPGTKQGEMNFIDDDDPVNTFMALFTMPIEQANTGLVCGTGTYRIFGGEGDYDFFWKMGTITMCREGQHTIYGTLEALTPNTP